MFKRFTTTITTNASASCRLHPQPITSPGAGLFNLDDVSNYLSPAIRRLLTELFADLRRNSVSAM